MIKRIVVWLLPIVMAAVALLIPAVALASFGIDPGKVYVENLYPGAQAEYTITVYNQGDTEESYLVRPRAPDYTDPDYEPFPYLDWITVTPEEVPVAGGGQADVTVVVRMPADADYYSGKNAEAWISFTVLNDEDMVQVELASRLFISTRPAGDGQVSITVDAQNGGGDSAGSGYSWVYPGVALGVAVVVGLVYFYINRRRKASR